MSVSNGFHKRIANALGITTVAGRHEGGVQSQHAMTASAMSAPIYLMFALANQGVNGATTMAAVSAAAALCALAAIVVLRNSHHATLPGHLFTLSLAVQVFGEMAFCGGLRAPAAALALLVVPAAIVTAGASAVRPWAIV